MKTSFLNEFTLIMNLSNNLAEEIQGKIQAQQINFFHQKFIIILSRQKEKNESDITLEIIPNKQLSIVRQHSTTSSMKKRRRQINSKKQDRQISNGIYQQQQQQKSIENEIIDLIKIDELKLQNQFILQMIVIPIFSI
ncbi:unnamed protein product [Paramecium primaurelia]|uniref:Uncharacterized protein n=1 Tax=Paramecium primaurelia TaxID=5886 RepID=A0A8S1M8X5_PARPR|nr:unnamed protein product [Paramecium primaurelia]